MITYYYYLNDALQCIDLSINFRITKFYIHTTLLYDLRFMPKFLHRKYLVLSWVRDARVYKLHKNILFIYFKSKKIRWETLNHKTCLFDVICTFKLDFVWQLKVNVLSFCWLFWLWIYCIWSIITHNFVLCYYS